MFNTNEFKSHLKLLLVITVLEVYRYNLPTISAEFLTTNN